MTTYLKILNTVTKLATLIVSGSVVAATAVAPSTTIADQTIMGSPVISSPILRPTTKSCTVTVVKDFQFDAFGKISEQPYQAPAACPPPWAKVILELNGKVDGAQYDRYGFIWYGQAELLRFTTPEPPHHAIHWHVEKDVTQYSSLFANTENPQKFLAQLDSATTPKLTGIYQINATLTFYEADKKYPSKPQPDIVKALVNEQKTEPFTIGPKAPSVSEAVTTIELPSHITSAYLEVYATPHGNEEFWYLPGGNIAPYRELQVYLDGKLAGIAWPFPYIYTGGFNPHLWTPIPAIDALNIPPYVIDLTPFAALLNTPLEHGKENTHKISIKLNVLADYWLIDSNLFLFNDAASPDVTGELTEYHVSPQVSIVELPTKVAVKDYKNRQITRSLTFTGSVKTNQGTTTTTLMQNFSLKNQFPVHPNAKNSIDQMMTQTVDTTTTTVHDKDNKVTSTQSAYTSLIAPSVDNMNTELPKAFAINQSMDKTMQSTLNGTKSAASVFYEEVKSESSPQTIEGILKNEYSGIEISFYKDSTGECFYQHLTSADNKLTGQVVLDEFKVKPNDNFDLNDSLSNKCN
jgi:hypothetical protein